MTVRLLALSFSLALAYAQRPPLESAWDLIAKGQRPQAVAILRNIIKSDPRNADARLLLGSVLMEDGDRTESLSQLNEAVRLRPKSAEGHNALGEAHNTFGDTKSAQTEFERAVALNPAFAQGHVNLAAALLQLGEADAAAKHLDRAIVLLGSKPDAAYPHYLRAKIYAESRDAANAATHLDRAVALRPDFAEAWSDLGEARKNLSDDDSALRAYSRAVELNPDDAVAQTRLGAKLLEVDKGHEAVAHLQRAARLDPNNQSTLNALQLALRRDGRRDEADAIKRRLTDLLRDKDKADQNLVAAIELNNKGATLEKAGDLPGAQEKYAAALAIYPEHIGIRTNLAVALLKLGRWKEGLQQMREALRRDPGNTDLQKALNDALAQAPVTALETKP